MTKGNFEQIAEVFAEVITQDANLDDLRDYVRRWDDKTQQAAELHEDGEGFDCPLVAFWAFATKAADAQIHVMKCKAAGRSPAGSYVWLHSSLRSMFLEAVRIEIAKEELGDCCDMFKLEGCEECGGC